ncbi:hypothetical protein KUCAC02_029798 [Chaenocephalus aceratus]|nr:hypothetical protein KUCAC02_029798 [Chaenocephalus aceratus]
MKMFPAHPILWSGCWFCLPYKLRRTFQMYARIPCLLMKLMSRDTQLFVNISICAGNKSVQSPDLSSEEKVGSRSLALHGHKMSHLILHFNFTLRDDWTVYVSKYDLNMLGVKRGPVSTPNISASIKDGGLLVTWGAAHSRADTDPYCFEYQLDMGDQETPKQFSDQLSYREPHVDPLHLQSDDEDEEGQLLCGLLSME